MLNSTLRRCSALHLAGFRLSHAVAIAALLRRVAFAALMRYAATSFRLFSCLPEQMPQIREQYQKAMAKKSRHLRSSAETIRQTPNRRSPGTE